MLFVISIGFGVELRWLMEERQCVFMVNKMQI